MYFITQKNIELHNMLILLNLTLKLHKHKVFVKSALLKLGRYDLCLNTCGCIIFQIILVIAPSTTVKVKVKLLKTNQYYVEVPFLLPYTIFKLHNNNRLRSPR